MQQQMVTQIMTGHTTKTTNSATVTPTINPTTTVQNKETMYRLDYSRRDLTDIDTSGKITSPSKPEGEARSQQITTDFPTGVFVG